MNIEILKRQDVPTPAAGKVYLFLDADNNNILSYKDENCVFNVYKAEGGLAIDNIGVDDCICDIVKDLSQALGKSASKGVITMPEFNTWWDNINIHRNFVVNPVTGEFSDSITASPVLIVAVEHTNVLCNGDSTGTATLTIKGGSAPYTVVWDGGANPSALPAGSFLVTVTDAAGTAVAKSVIITEPALLTVVTGTTPDGGGGDGTATATPAGGTTPYTYVWNDNGGAPIGQTTATATALVAGTYQVIVTDDNGCTAQDLNVVVA